MANGKHSFGEGLALPVVFTATAAVLILMTLTVFWPVRHYDFINYDDPLYLTRNATVKQGLTAQSIAWAFTTFEAANWHPLAWLSHLTDVSLFGLDPGRHHLMSLLLHAMAAVGLLFFLSSATGKPWPSALVSALFAVHPLHVESAVWLSQRKDVLMGLFSILTFAAYLHYLRRPNMERLGLFTLSGALAIMAKPTAVVLPPLLLLLDWWPLGRWQYKRPWNLLREKAPLFCLAFAAGLITLAAQTKAGAVDTAGIVSFPWRAANALAAAAWYIGKSFWPSNLAVIYPHPRDSLAVSTIIISAAVVIAITAGAVNSRRRYPMLLSGWLFYLISLAPVLGLIQAGIQARADRYTYLSLIGLAVAAIWTASDLTPRAALPLATPATVLALILFGATANLQLVWWRDSLSLFGHAVAVTGDNPIARLNLAQAQSVNGLESEAVINLQRALETAPNLVPARLSLANIFLKQGRTAEAAVAYAKVLDISPQNAAAHHYLGVALAEAGHADDALIHLDHAVRLDPLEAAAYYHRGLVNEGKGNYDAAASDYNQALKLNPDYAAAHNNLGAMLARNGNFAAAKPHFESALRLDPANDTARANLERLRGAVP